MSEPPTSTPTSPEPGPGRDPRRLARRALFFVIVASAVAALLWFGRESDFDAITKTILGRIEAMGPWAPLAFVGLYIILVPACLPGGPFTLGAGFLLGVVQGTVAVTIGTALGACVSFALARGAFRNFVRERLRERAWVWEIDTAVSEEGWKVVMLTRMIPLFPFKLSNYAFGLTEVSFRGFFFGTLFGVIPLTALNCYLGQLAAQAVAHEEAGAAQWAARIITLAALALGVAYATRLARRIWKRTRERG